jgi:hypothetical protein
MSLLVFPAQLVSKLAELCLFSPEHFQTYHLGELKRVPGRMVAPVRRSLWQSGTRNIHLDGFNEATGCAISGILTFGGGDKQGLAVFTS